jgi:two-component system response regulator CpxR
MPTVLLIEDDLELARMLEEYLVPEGFAVRLRHDGVMAMPVPPEIDLVVLDVMLPGRSGFDVLRDIRRAGDLPVILLTARDNETDRVVGLELGADDYVPKPFNPRELVARIRAVLRRARRGDAPQATTLSVGDVLLDSGARVAWRGGQPLDLTSAEFALLERLLRRAGQPVSRDELAQAALGRAGTLGLDRNVDTLVSKLRRKLGADDPVKTVRNIGYVFAVPPRADG